MSSKLKHYIHGEYSVSEINNVVDEWIYGQYAERNREILKCRFIRGLTIEATAEEMELSDTCVKDVVYKYADLVQRHLESNREEKENGI